MKTLRLGKQQIAVIQEMLARGASLRRQNGKVHYHEDGVTYSEANVTVPLRPLVERGILEEVDNGLACREYRLTLEAFQYFTDLDNIPKLHPFIEGMEFADKEEARFAEEMANFMEKRGAVKQDFQKAFKTLKTR